ncbi:MAG TPA: hypothetical protein VIP57_01640 [Candidatus Dormibacteraeota bacterium]
MANPAYSTPWAAAQQLMVAWRAELSHSAAATGSPRSRYFTTSVRFCQQR